MGEDGWCGFGAVMAMRVSCCRMTLTLPGRAGSVIRRRTHTVRGQVLSRDGPLRLAHEMLVAAEVVALPFRRSDAGFGGP